MKARKYAAILPILLIWGVPACRPEPRKDLKKQARTTIFATTPALTEIVLAVCPDSMVPAVCKGSDFPERVIAMPQITTLPMDLESLQQLKPTYIVAEKNMHDSRTLDLLKRMGIQIKEVELTDFEGLYRVLDSLGTWTGLEAQAAKVVTEVKASLQDTEGALKERNIHLGVLFSGNPVMGYGGHNWMDAKLRWLGVANALAYKPGSFFNISFEELADQKGMTHLAVPVYDSARFDLLRKARPDLKYIYLNEDLETRPSVRLRAQLDDIVQAIDKAGP